MKVIISEVKRNIKSPTSLFFVFVYVLFFLEVKSGFSRIEATVFATTLLIITMSLSGFISISKDKNSGFVELVGTTGSERFYYLSKILGQVFAVIIYMIPLFVYGISLKFTLPADLSWGFGETLHYLFIYYFIAGCTSALLGMCFGELIPGKIGMILTFILSIMMTSLATLAINFIPVINTLIPLYKIAEKLNIAQYSSITYDGLIYGFDLESVRLFLRVGYSLFLVSLFYLLIYKSRRKKFFLKLFLVFLVSSGVFFYLSNDTVFVRKLGRVKPDSKSFQEEYYYSIYNKDVKSPNEPGVYQLLAFEGDVDLRKALDVKGTMKIKLLEDTNHLDFSLYHGFKVDKIELDGDPLTYKQEMDIVNIQLPRERKQNDILNLMISYKGLSSQHFFAGQRGTMLASNFNWLPKSGKYFSFQSGDVEGAKEMIRVFPLFENTEVDYTLRVKSRYKVLSNLTENEGVFQGTSSNGIYLLSGRYIERQYGDKVYVYDPEYYQFIFPEENKTKEDIQSNYLSELFQKAYGLVGIDYQPEFTRFLDFKFSEELFLSSLPGIKGIHDMPSFHYGNTIIDSAFYFNNKDKENMLITNILINEIYNDPKIRSRDELMRSDLLFLFKSIGRLDMFSLNSSGIDQLTGARRGVYDYIQEASFETAVGSLWRWYQMFQQRDLTYDEVLNILQEENF